MGFDSKDYKQVLGRFSTGVTICTSAMGTSRRGMTANSFTSVSLNPPLILVCVDTHRTIDHFISTSGSFAVNILREDQKHIAEYFAGKPPVDLTQEHDRLFGLPFHTEVTGAPLLDDCLATLDCSLFATYPGGDHAIYVGKVEQATVNKEATPLLFFSSRYYQLGKIV